MGHPSHPPLSGPPRTTPPPKPRIRGGCGGCLMGKDSTLLITIFSLLELSPANRMEKNINFLAWLYPMSKGFTARARVLSMQRQCPGRAGVQPPPQHPAPGGDTPRPPRARAESHHGRGQGWGPSGGFPELWFNPAGKLQLGSSGWGQWRGQAACVSSPAVVEAFEPNLTGFGQEKGKAGPCIPLWAPSSVSLLLSA